jgi:diguanylate cyclase (GGDEF)-like protein/PAS domain S-box-containing protein
MPNSHGFENIFVPGDIFKTAFQHSGDAIFILDNVGTILEANLAACQQTGCAQHELLNTNASRFHESASAEIFNRYLERVTAEGEVDFEAVHQYHEGPSIPVDIRLRRFEHGGRQFILESCRPSAMPPQCEIEYEKIVQATGEGYWMVSAQDASIIDTNDTFCHMVGYSRDELLSMTISDLEVIESPEETASHIRKVMEDGHDIFETRHRHKDGHILEFEVSVSFADIRGGVIFVFVRDISERKRQEAALQLSSLVVNASTASVVVTDAENHIVSVNPAFTRITGYRPSEVIGHDPKLLGSGKQNKGFYQDMWRILLATGHWEGEWWNRRKDGEEYAEQVNLNLLRNDDGSIFRFVKIATDITEKKRLDDEVWRQANYDSITNLPNRRLLYDRLTHEMKKCDRTGESLALFYLDLDSFKVVNDNHGHAVGDMLLVDVARRIGSCIRSTDTVARLGGDEFAVLLTNLTDTSRVETVAQDMIHLLGQPYRLGDVDARISGSIGIALYPDDGRDKEELMKVADFAMYTAKREGKNCFKYSHQ